MSEILNSLQETLCMCSQKVIQTIINTPDESQKWIRTPPPENENQDISMASQFYVIKIIKIRTFEPIIKSTFILMAKERCVANLGEFL